MELAEVFEVMQSGRLAEAIERVAGLLASLPVQRFSRCSQETLLENERSLSEFIYKCVEEANQALKTKMVALEMNEYDLNPDGWFCNIGFSEMLVDPNESDDNYRLFESRAYFPRIGGFELFGCPGFRSIFKEYFELSSRERNSFKEQDARAAGSKLVELRFFELVESCFRALRQEGKLADSFRILATIEGADYYYICR